MENTFATFEPIGLNSNPSKEEIAQYYLNNNTTTENDYLDKYFGISAPITTSPSIGKPDYNIRELLAPTTANASSRNTSLSSGAKESQIINYFINKGLTKAQASGIAGNLKAESSLDTDIYGDGGTSYGLAQWHGPRKTKLEQFAKNNQKPASDLKTQLDFLWHELQTSESETLKGLLNTQTPEESAKVFAHKFERMAKYSPIREQFALQFFNNS